MATDRGSRLTTRGITITVVPCYLKEESQPEGTDIRRPLFVFGYGVRIHNEGEWPVKLLRRHWEIVDGLGDCKVVDGDGVIGQQPEIVPGQIHEYASYAQIHTEWGTMEGHFVMQVLDGPESGAQMVIPVKRWYLVAEE